MKIPKKYTALGLVLLSASLAQAQTGKSKPPISQAWLDVATYSGMGMPGMGGGMNPMSLFGGGFGGGSRNSFGNTMAGTAGSWLDVTLSTRNNPNLTEGIQAVPAGTKLAPELKLIAPKSQKAVPPVADEEQVVREEFEPPKGKMYLYWGCGETVRPGQPKVLDISKLNPVAMQNFFSGRRATQRGAHLAAGRPVWPNEQDARVVPEGASLVGEHIFKGQGVSDGFKFHLGQAQDIMPPIVLDQRKLNGATQLDWKGLPTARAYFISAMGARGENEMVFWSSSEVQESGTGLIDYQTNSAIDRWLQEKVLLPAEARTCSVPKGVFAEGAMLRMIAYGSELNLAHPPRPTNPKQVWEPQWAVKVRVKSVANAMLGENAFQGQASPTRESAHESRPLNPEPSAPATPLDSIGQGVDKLRGVFGF